MSAAIMRRVVDEVLNAPAPDAVAELFHPDYVYRAPGEELQGVEGLTALLNGYRTAFPDLHVEIDELLDFGDATLMAFTMTGTHRGPLMGHAPTLRRIAVHGMVRSRFRGGRVVEEWEILDRLALFEQLGLVGGES